MLYVGERVGEYTVTASLGAGGMATLYLGERAGAAGFACEVAIKAIHADLADDPTFVRMFVDEALLASRIHHPNVVRVEQLVESDGAYYLVMEYVRGCSLAHLLRTLGRRQRRVSPTLAVWIATQVADGLHAAHEACGDDGEPLGVVHRDVSPQNVLLSSSGHVKLIDFGIAKAGGRERTAVGTVRGKVRYMAPEQVKHRSVDRRADVYALGVVLWEMLTMRALVDVDAPPVDDASARVASVRTYAPHVSAALDAVVATALAAEPSDRFATAQDLRRALGLAQPDAQAIGADEMAALIEAVGATGPRTGPGAADARTGSEAATAPAPSALTSLTMPSRPGDTTPDAHGDDAPVRAIARTSARATRFAAAGLGLVTVAVATALLATHARRPAVEATHPTRAAVITAATTSVAQPADRASTTAPPPPPAPAAPRADPVVARVARRGHAHARAHRAADAHGLPLVERFTY